MILFQSISGLRFRSGTYPPALPKWEGSLLSDGFGDFPLQRDLLFSKGIAASPLGEAGEGSLLERIPLQNQKSDPVSSRSLL